MISEPKFPRAVPQVNNNGTSGEELVEQRLLTRSFIRKAIEVLRQQVPHARDYQTVDRECYDEARALHNVRLTALQEIADDLHAEALAILYQGK